MKVHKIGFRKVIFDIEEKMGWKELIELEEGLKKNFPKIKFVIVNNFR